MSKKILWIINPNAGSGNHDALVEFIKEKSNDRIYLTDGKHDKSNIQELVNQFNPELVVVGGGDGTIKFCATLLKDKNVLIGVIPLGSANGLAAEFGINHSSEIIVDKYLNSEYKKIDLDAIEINKDHYCFHLSDIGLNARIVKGFEDQPVRGFTGYALGALDQLTNEDWYFSVNCRGKKYRTLMVIIANAKKYGTGVIINPKGKIDDGSFELGILKEINTRLVGQVLFKTEELPNKEWFQIESVKEIEIETDQEVDLQIDGEYIEPVKHVKARILPRFTKMAIPEF